MRRLVWLLVPLVACGGPPRVPSKLFANGGGECTEQGGCEAPVEPQPRFEPPDVDHPVPDPDRVPPPITAEPREATCSDVAVSASALELGNYAEEAQRAPVLAKYKARCLRAKLDREERQCVFEAIDAPSVAYCAPRFWPEVPVKFVAVTECPAIAHEIGVRMAPHTANSNGVFDRYLAAVLRSCEQDRWTVELATCARGLHMPQYVTHQCTYQAPAALRTKLTERIAQVK